jgi:hypothetical protein
MDDVEGPPRAALVENAWEQFQAKVLPAALNEPTPEAIECARLSFYFGALALFGIMTAVLDGAASEEAVDLARDNLAEELDAFLADHDADLH